MWLVFLRQGHLFGCSLNDQICSALFDWTENTAFRICINVFFSTQSRSVKLKVPPSVTPLSAGQFYLSCIMVLDIEF